MAKVHGILATTAIVERGSYSERITKEALEAVAGQVEESDAIPMTIDHDPFSLPIGKIEKAWVEQIKEDYALVAQIHVEDGYSIVTHLRSGDDLVLFRFEDSPKPLAGRSYVGDQILNDTLSVDLAKFAKLEEYASFESDVRSIDDKIICENKIGRYSVTPEPFMQFVLSNPDIASALAFGVWMLRRAEKFVRYTVDETLRKVGDEIADSLSKKMKAILRSYKRSRAHDKRAPVIQIVIPGELELILLVKTEFDEDFPTIELRKLVEEMDKYGDLLQGASSAVFGRVGANDWELQYLTMRTGEVVGSVDCYNRTMGRLLGFGQKQDSKEDSVPPKD